jgi:hypothetical protein
MNKSATLITAALLSFGFAASSMAADMPKSAAPMAADTGTATGTPATKSHKSGKTGKSKSNKSHHKSTTAPTTTK